MHIQSIRVARYRSLGDVTLQPGNLTALVGPNNAGKTNFAESLEFLSETHRYGLELAVSRKGGFDNIAHRKQRRTKLPVFFHVIATADPAEIRNYSYLGTGRVPASTKIEISHAFNLVARGQGIRASFRVGAERLEISRVDPDSRETIALVEREGSTLTRIAAHPTKGAFWQRLLFPLEDASYVRALQTQGIPETELFVGGVVYNNLLSYFARSMGEMRLYQLVPLELRRPGVPTPSPDLDVHGSNLAAFVESVKATPSAWEAVLGTMRRVMPGLIDIRTDFTEDRRVSLRFVEAGRTRPWTSDEVSDGTVQVLALLAALFDPRAAFTIFEEPENSMHPWIIRSFVDACRFAEGKQIVLTTHSPVLLNRLEPHEVVVVYRENGETVLRPLKELDPHVSQMWIEGEGFLASLLDSGAIPEAVPPGP